ncbi:hypothetical protein [Methylobacterium frigidaeris]|uniref:Uncharacterized protein n=1 Tax=Methylobacterium frigidaeris TaxID=2038277 RepID=A0AA37HGR1_9HYPH|nr:hypothetical protein [Methylobacterium frigidaeris]PIK69608.1 hypothetical protein CS379_28940 [Methylobacterium frigidaeris]GJD65254.1 hypothetical protein MPEAHAMD_5441 [Methylobacterium frigidaeris]
MTDPTSPAATLRALLAILVKSALIADEARLAGWRREAADLHRRLGGQDLSALKLDGIWTLAVREAEVPDLRPDETQVSLTMPQSCPLSLDELTEPGFDVDGAVDRVRKSASTG